MLPLIRSMTILEKKGRWGADKTESQEGDDEQSPVIHYLKTMNTTHSKPISQRWQQNKDFLSDH